MPTLLVFLFINYFAIVVYGIFTSLIDLSVAVSDYDELDNLLYVLKFTFLFILGIFLVIYFKPVKCSPDDSNPNTLCFSPINRPQ